jgi:hypothetical protein
MGKIPVHPESSDLIKGGVTRGIIGKEILQGIVGRGKKGQVILMTVISDIFTGRGTPQGENTVHLQEEGVKDAVFIYIAFIVLGSCIAVAVLIIGIFSSSSLNMLNSGFSARISS